MTTGQTPRDTRATRLPKDGAVVEARVIERLRQRRDIEVEPMGSAVGREQHDAIDLARRTDQFGRDELPPARRRDERIVIVREPEVARVSSCASFRIVRRRERQREDG